MSGGFHIVGQEEVLRHEGDATRPSRRQQNMLHICRNQPAGPAALLWIRPAPNARLIAPSNFSDDGSAAANGDNGLCRVHDAVQGALFAPSRQPISVRISQYSPPHCLSDIRTMPKIDGNWIRDRLKGERGEVARLADALGMDKNKLAKVMSGTRALTADETVSVLTFFRIITPEMLELDAQVRRIDRLPPEARKMVDRFVDSLLSDQENLRDATDLGHLGDPVSGQAKASP